MTRRPKVPDLFDRFFGRPTESPPTNTEMRLALKIMLEAERMSRYNAKPEALLALLGDPTTEEAIIQAYLALYPELKQWLR